MEEELPRNQSPLSTETFKKPGHKLRRQTKGRLFDTLENF